MWAILSDIHGNWEALAAVVADAQQAGVSRWICLGDTIGYGPNPAECLDWSMKCDVCVLGNSDELLLFPTDDSQVVRSRTYEWTHEALFPTASPSESVRRRDFLEGLPRAVREADCLFVHASPRSPLHEYLFPQDARDPHKFPRLWPLVDGWCFVGHTHLPGVFPFGSDFVLPTACSDGFVRGDQKAVVNVGSVGQPRDGDPRASYVLFDGTRARFRRVEYDAKVTVGKIRNHPELADPQVERWLSGSAAT